LIIGTFSSSKIFAFSAAPENSSEAFAPKGLSVSERISLIAARVYFAPSGPVARIPKPPALETAATIFGVLIQLIP